MDLTPSERNRHVYIIGKTASGKSTLAATMAINDINENHGVAFLDPHGPDVLNILDNIPPHRRPDVCYIDLSDPIHSVAFNVIAKPQHLLSSLRAIWDDSWGPRLAWFLINGLYVLHENPGTTLLDLPRVYYDATRRGKLLDNVRNPVVQKFWRKEFPSYPPRYREEAKGPILNKVGQFLAVPAIYASLKQVTPALDLNRAISGRQIILINLAKGVIGDDACSLYGALFLGAFKDAVMNGPARSYNLYVDEFQSFGSTIFAPMLSETRKFGLNITISHQFLSQLKPEVRDAILGNVGTIISFRIGDADADIIAREFSDDVQGLFNRTKLTNLPPFQAYMRRPEGSAEIITTDPIATPFQADRSLVINESRMRFARKV